ncbi:MAG: type II toxin-antitoxin system Phd/YefM family antitoxin [Desulfovibrio sp.]|nr:type II toxin-antitoxin system Phd/YefM family antitoxin [Desulfovibrio sp.]
MMINTNSMVSISEANQNFSRVARLASENGVAVILKNNVPRYVLLEYSQFQDDSPAVDADVLSVGKKILKRYAKAFEDLAK